MSRTETIRVSWEVVLIFIIQFHKNGITSFDPSNAIRFSDGLLEYVTAGHAFYHHGEKMRSRSLYPFGCLCLCLCHDLESAPFVARTWVNDSVIYLEASLFDRTSSHLLCQTPYDSLYHYDGPPRHDSAAFSEGCRCHQSPLRASSSSHSSRLAMYLKASTHSVRSRRVCDGRR